MAALVAGRLDTDARRRVIEHLARCANCSSRVVSASARPRTRQIWPSAIVVIAIVAATVGSREPTPGIASLVRVSDVLRVRAFDGRLSGGFAHKPLRVSSTSPPMNVAAAASRVRSAGQDAHASGVALLLIADYDGAIAMLESAPKNARVYSDLSAAYHARASAKDHALDYEAALDAAERGWRLSRTPETAWNRAIAISAFHLTDATHLAWDDFLRLETDAAWRAEALARRAALAGPTELDEWRRLEPQLRTGADPREAEDIVRRFPAHALIHVEETLLPAWAKAQLEGRGTDARASLSLGRMMAATLSATGEHLATDTIAAIDAACRDERSCHAIARAHHAYANGLALVSAKEHARAAVAFREAEEEFAKLRSPYVYAARHRLGETMVQATRIADAVRTGETLIADLEGRRYRRLEAYAHRFLGLAVLHQARPEESIAHYERARRLFAEAEDSAKVGAVEILLADAHEYAGDRERAMKHRFAAFRAIQRSGEAARPDSLFETGSSSSWRGWPYAAEFFLAEATREALRQNNYTLAAVSSFWRSSVAASRDDFAAAREHARLASEYSARTGVEQRTLLAATASQHAPAGERAAEKLTEAIQLLESNGNRAFLPELLRRRADMHEQAGDAAAAEADLRQVVDIAEEVLGDEAPVAMLDGFASDVRRHYEDLIRLLIARGATDEALVYAERARRRGVGSGDVAASIRAIPSSTAAAVIELQRDAIVVWLVTRDSVKLFRWTGRVPHAVLEQAPSPETLAVLYDALLEKWIAHVPRGADLVILPPPSLAGVPFSALQNRETGRSVFDDYAVSVAFSLASLQNESPVLIAADAMLIVGDPTYRQLPRLPHSRGETAKVACHYPNRELLLGPEATADAFMRALDRADALHFGGHAMVNDYAPEQSSLMLAATPAGEDARVYVHELLQRKKPMKLVVLSACSTAKSRSGSARGTLTIARAFLDGGAQTVVGTLWPVSDDAAAVFSARLHEELARGRTVAHAVRAAQLYLRSQTPNDSTWAAFCVLRGNEVDAGG